MTSSQWDVQKGVLGFVRLSHAKRKLLCLEGPWPAPRVMLMQGWGRQMEGMGPVKALFSC